MAPGASGSGKLTLLESKIHKVGLAAADATIVQKDLFAAVQMPVVPASQDAINSLLRKNLMTMFKNSRGEISFRFSSRDEAKSMGNMESDEKLVLDQIKDSGNQGIWIKTLKAKTGLHATIITRVIKTLDSSKRIKVVKSVKNPTRKMYMLAGTTPSVELTGGPWFTDNELDVEFVGALKKCAYKLLARDSIPNGSFQKLYPTSATRFLPTVRDINAYIKELKVSAVELLDEHVEALLDLMVFDGTIEKILVSGRSNGGSTQSKKRMRDDDEEEGSDSDAGPKGKGKGKGKRATKKAKRKAQGDESEAEEEDEESAEESFDEDEAPEVTAQRKQAKTSQSKGSSLVRRKRRPASDNEGHSDSSLSSGHDSDDAETIKRKQRAQRKKQKSKAAKSDAAEPIADVDFVYRLVKPYERRVGWTEMPCGNCPSEAFCAEPDRMSGAHHSATAKPPPRHPSMFTAKPDVQRTKAGEILSNPRVAIAVEADRTQLGLDGLMRGVGMMGGQGAAVGTSSDKWGSTSARVGGNVAPVNPRDCVYFANWLHYD